ncbi:MAG TPA: beta-ketoacyl-ACP synthase III [Pseudonocardiaceae bacterium]
MAHVHGSTITGLGAYRPGRLMTNEELSAATTVGPDWILERTGIATRHHAADGEDVVTMAAEAARKAVGSAGVGLDEIDLLIVATATKRQRMPGAAPRVAHRVGIPACGAFDVNAVCAGFTYAVSLASNAVRLGEARNVVVVGADRMTDYIYPEDPATYVIFGDGAGAVVISRSATADIGPVVWGSDGGRAPVLETRVFDDGEQYVAMDGPLVYKWSTVTMPAVARRACELAGVELADLDWFVPHQANRRIVDNLAGRLGIPDEKVARDVVDTGNTSAASVPLALGALRDSGRTSPGDLALVLGFGAGLTYAGQVVRLP